MNEAKQASDGYDVVIVGGGIVGAATLYQLQLRYPDRTMLLIEKEAGLADHQTGNNSGVIHSGLYYPPGSLKAKNCVEGRRALVRFAQEHNIPHDVCGKVVVAVEDSELPMLEKLLAREGKRRVLLQRSVEIRKSGLHFLRKMPAHPVERTEEST